MKPGVRRPLTSCALNTSRLYCRRTLEPARLLPRIAAANACHRDLGLVAGSAGGAPVARRHAGKQRSECGAVVVPVVLVELADRLDKGVDQQHALVLGDLHRDSSFGES